jgi:hypothetical protein
MYRYTQTLPGGAITLVGVLALSFLIPGWTASALGWDAAHAQLISWIFRQQGFFCVILLLLYSLSGFGLLVSAGMAIYVASLVLMRTLIAVRGWAVRTSIAAAQGLGELLYWPVQIGGELLWDEYQRRAALLTALWHEQRELRRMYRQDYAGDFPSYRAFLRHWRALRKREQAASEADPLEQAIRLMGLPENFTRDDLKQRFRTLIDRIHPDKAGPNELAAQLIAAYTLICKRKNWR